MGQKHGNKNLCIYTFKNTRNHNQRIFHNSITHHGHLDQGALRQVFISQARVVRDPLSHAIPKRSAKRIQTEPSSFPRYINKFWFQFLFLSEPF